MFNGTNFCRIRSNGFFLLNESFFWGWGGEQKIGKVGRSFDLDLDLYHIVAKKNIEKTKLDAKLEP